TTAWDRSRAPTRPGGADERATFRPSSNSDNGRSSLHPTTIVESRMPVPGVSIGQLARSASVSVQTLRQYHRLGLLRPSRVSTAGYRFYTDDDRARLDLIRALRGLDFDLDTIGRLLRGALTAHAAAVMQLDALNLQARALDRRRSVLRVVLESATP